MAQWLREIAVLVKDLKTHSNLVTPGDLMPSSRLHRHIYICKVYTHTHTHLLKMNV